MSKYSDMKSDESKRKKIRDEDDQKDNGNATLSKLEDNRIQTTILEAMTEHKEDDGMIIAHDLNSKDPAKGPGDKASESEAKEDVAIGLVNELTSKVNDKNEDEEKDN